VILSAFWVCALLTLSGMSPSECQTEERGKRQEKLTDGVGTAAATLGRSLAPGTPGVAVADAGYASSKLPDRC